MSQSAVQGDADIPSEPIHRLTVAQYRAMARIGILTPDDHVELLEGWLVEKMTKNPPHRIATRRARVALERIVPQGWYVDTQEPIATMDSEPEPDVAVIRGSTEDYPDRNPEAENVALVIEVADRTLLRDRHLKARVYARAAIPCYWIVNLAERVVEVHMDPSGPADDPGYRARTIYGADDTIIVRIENTAIGQVVVNDVLP